MRIFIYDKAASVYSAGLTYVLHSCYPNAEVIRTGDPQSHTSLPPKIDLLILFQEKGQPIPIEEWKNMEAACGHPPCLALLDTVSYKTLKQLLNALPLQRVALAEEVNEELITTVIEKLNPPEIFFSKAIIALLYANLSTPDENDEANLYLTRRESQVLDWVRQGKNAHQIAAEMSLSVNTVQVFLSKLRKKFRVRSTLALIHKK